MIKKTIISSIITTSLTVNPFDSYATTKIDSSEKNAYEQNDSILEEPSLPTKPATPADYEIPQENLRPIEEPYYEEPSNIKENNDTIPNSHSSQNKVSAKNIDTQDNKIKEELPSTGISNEFPKEITILLLIIGSFFILRNSIVKLFV